MLQLREIRGSALLTALVHGLDRLSIEEGKRAVRLIAEAVGKKQNYRKIERSLHALR